MTYACNPPHTGNHNSVVEKKSRVEKPIPAWRYLPHLAKPLGFAECRLRYLLHLAKKTIAWDLHNLQVALPGASCKTFGICRMQVALPGALCKNFWICTICKLQAWKLDLNNL